MKQAQMLVVLGLSMVVGCSVPNTPPPASPSAPAPAPPASVVPSAEPAPVPPDAVGPVPEACRAYRAEPTECADSGQPLAALDRALAIEEPRARDQALASLTGCEAFEPGVMVALRAELAPAACADVVVGEALPIGAPDALAETLRALVHAAHLNRLVVKAPRLEPPFSKQQFAEFSKSVLNQWVVTQAQAVYKIAQQGVKLHGYARGVVAVESGLADMRFVRVVREVPLPEEMADEELQDAYFAELDVALTPWKDRGRDAALLGLREFAEAGILVDARVAKARGLLSELYGGRRINRLDGLLLPELPPLEVSSLEQRLALKLPTHLLAYVLPDLEPTEPGVLRCLLERGIPASMRADLQSRSLDPATAALLARAFVVLGQRYWRSTDFRAAAALLAKANTGPEARLVRGLAEALEGGPQDAAEMMLRGPRLSADVGNVAALDLLIEERGPLWGLAAFDAAYLLELVPPAGDPAFWQDLERRYRQAAQALVGEPQTRARQLAEVAQQTAKALSAR